MISLGRRSSTQKFGGKEIKLQQTEQPTATNMTVKRQIFPQLKGFLFSRKYFSSFLQMGHFWHRNGNKAEYIIFHVPGVYNFRRILRVSLFHSGFFLKKIIFPIIKTFSNISFWKWLEICGNLHAHLPKYISRYMSFEHTIFFKVWFLYLRRAVQVSFWRCVHETRVALVHMWTKIHYSYKLTLNQRRWNWLGHLQILALLISVGSFTCPFFASWAVNHNMV